MPYYESPALYVDMARLPAPEVLETILYEDLLASYKNRVLALNGDLAQALTLEQSPLNIILETEAYGELIVRQRINAAAKAVMLPFATGSNLDVLGALYNVARLPVVTSPRSFLTNPEDWQTDTAFRAQIQKAPEAFSTAGSAGAYEFQAMDADVTLRDAAAIKVDNFGRVKVVLMNSGDDPTATSSQIANVTTRLFDPAIKPLTDALSIVSVDVTPVDVKATIILYQGPDAASILKAINAAMTSLKAQINQIGRSLTLSSLYAALTQEGVADVIITSPTKDVMVTNQGCVSIKSITVTPSSNRVE